MEDGKKRVRRSRDEIVKTKISVLEDKINSWQKKIDDAKKEIEELNNPKPSVKKRDITNKIDELNLDYNDVMKAIEKMGKK